MTTTCAIETGSGPSLRTVSSIAPGTSFVRSIASSSAGGPVRSPRPGPPSAENAPTAAMISSSGTRPSTHEGMPRPAGSRAALGGGGAGLHQGETSKKPIQPSSVNSDWWAWNMYLPAFGKRISRIPRWPWQSITVSVNSLGSRDEPVGK